MPSPQLDNLVRIGQLKAEPAAQAELDGLMRSGAVRIKDAENRQLSIESRFDPISPTMPPMRSPSQPFVFTVIAAKIVF